MFPKGVCHATLNPDAPCAKWTCALSTAAPRVGSSLTSIHFSSPLRRPLCKFKSRLISHSPPWAKINPNYEITAKHMHNAIRNYWLDIFPQVLPRVGPLSPAHTERDTETVWELRRHINSSFGLSISIKANSVSYQLFNSQHHMVSLDPICSH